MRLGIVTIQKNRGQWLVEWIAFHYLVGFRKFYIYLHGCSDASEDIVLKLTHLYDITAQVVSKDTVRPQLVAFQHAYDNYSHEVDWMAFIDGDEFLFPTRCRDMRDALEFYRYKKISAIGVYWKCFGSSGHISEPTGLITENFRLCSCDDLLENRHIKSVVKGGQSIACKYNAHLFDTVWGTVDEGLRPIHQGWMKEYEPTYESFRINHYVCQSWSFFKQVKQTSGAADAGRDLIRPDEGFFHYDEAGRIFDCSLDKYAFKLKLVVDDLNDYLQLKLEMPPSA
jgi:hypothetical protein